MKPVYFFIIFLIVFLWIGIQGLYTAVTNLKPAAYSVAEYLQNKPSSKWLRLTGGAIDLTGLNYKSLFGVGPVTQIYVPLRPPGGSPGDKVSVLVLTKDPALLHTAELMRQINSEDDAFRFMQEHRNDLVVRRNVEGLIRFGINIDGREKSKLERLDNNLAPDFVILAEGESPEYVWPVITLITGAFLGVWMLRNCLRTSSPPTSRPPPSLPGQSPPSPRMI